MTELASSPVKRPRENNKLNGSTITEGTIKMYKRDPAHRVFVNRSLNMAKIKIFGFDMDYTLAVYKSPVYEDMGFEKLKERLVAIGYPKEIEDFKYDPAFPCRGLWFDRQFGTLLKVDCYGNVLVAVHGFRFMKSYEIGKMYPNKYVQLDENRIYVLNTLFNIPETYMIACMIDFFISKKDYEQSDMGVRCGDLFMSYKSIFQDIRNSVDWVHFHGDMKDHTVQNLEKFVHKDKRLPLFLERIRQHGQKTMIITNSDYKYTNKIMEYLLDFPEFQQPEQGTKGRDWITFFDYVVVDAKKPMFFKDGTILRKVDRATGSLSLGHHMGPLEKGCVYSGGSVDVISELVGAKGKDVLYVGDHIFGDILKSKKERGWRTFLVVPEMAQELKVWTEQKSLFDQIENLECEMADSFRDLDSSTREIPDISKYKKEMMETVHKLDLSYGMLGSIFRSGSRQTFFSAQVQRYADLYTSNLLSLLHYPFTYMFRAPSMLMPHESTVDHDRHYAVEDGDTSLGLRQRPKDFDIETPTKIMRQNNVPHLHANMPCKVTHYHDEDEDSDEDSSSAMSDKSG
ncbi:cytosolic purine 5'-nucleotidase-like isoform X1 [Mytilus californianus]|uniref:cytosolic purine 5'-nucleotidase-like isoform X1 n=1 Tax=Mytilus californianus TaxID=6549 RepID=UPI00224649B7|nr:cytosolic purine 5'-nucleotidase-like isoform X1 [Mytilus californianus]XP_052100994.1 cytosolic purine 5'-nucleotidase-like isoform X1 [Mytilus californianus]